MDLIEQNKVLHQKGAFNGGSVIHFEKIIKTLIKVHDAKSLLDYGCGKGIFYQTHAWGIKTTLYDPAVEQFAKPPEQQFDGTICVDVLEHLPEHEVVPTLCRLVDLTDKFLFLTFCDRPATKFLPDGRNAHLTLKPETWWVDKIRELNSPTPIYLRNNTTFVDDHPRIV